MHGSGFYELKTFKRPFSRAFSYAMNQYSGSRKGLFGEERWQGKRHFYLKNNERYGRAGLRALCKMVVVFLL